MISQQVQVDSLNSPELFQLACAILWEREGWEDSFIEIPSIDTIQITAWKDDFVKPRCYMDIHRMTNDKNEVWLTLSVRWECLIKEMEEQVARAVLEVFAKIWTDFEKNNWWLGECEQLLSIFPYAFNKISLYQRTTGRVFSFRLTPTGLYLVNDYSCVNSLKVIGPNYRALYTHRIEFFVNEDLGGEYLGVDYSRAPDKANLLLSREEGMSFIVSSAYHRKGNKLGDGSAWREEYSLNDDLRKLESLILPNKYFNNILVLSSPDSTTQNQFAFFYTRGYAIGTKSKTGRLIVSSVQNIGFNECIVKRKIIQHELSNYSGTILFYENDGEESFFLCYNDSILSFRILDDKLSVTAGYSINDFLPTDKFMLESSQGLYGEEGVTFSHVVQDISPEPIFDGKVFTPLMIDNTPWEAKNTDNLDLLNIGEKSSFGNNTDNNVTPRTTGTQTENTFWKKVVAKYEAMSDIQQILTWLIISPIAVVLFVLIIFVLVEFVSLF